MNNPTDTNQASEEIEQHLLNDKAFQHILKFAPESQRELMTFELARYINALIRTEKLKLLDRLEKQATIVTSLIGEKAGTIDLTAIENERNRLKEAEL